MEKAQGYKRMVELSKEAKRVVKGQYLGLDNLPNPPKDTAHVTVIGPTTASKEVYDEALETVKKATSEFNHPRYKLVVLARLVDKRRF